ncbi:hypothetical protein [Streptomyces sp. NPDC060275]|uniref:hypothetical protein n=1 Tax=Streptomyces sp. NPDC060275 TaxID=3347090 RepID=UPI00365DD1DE
MTGNQIEALVGMLATFGLLVLMILPSVIGIVRDRRIDRQIREARDGGEARAHHGKETQKSSDRSTVPSTATWYAEGRRSKKLVNS